jgi:signal transduction histidine kinase/ActR/RegA family two-component response regulator
MLLKPETQRWGTALVLAIAATAASVILGSLNDTRVQFLPFFPAILIVGITVGTVPAVLTLLLAIVTVALSWLPRANPTGGALRGVADLALCLLCGGVAVAVADMASRRIREARRAGTRLDLALAGGRMATWEWTLSAGTMMFWEGSASVFGRNLTTVDEAWGCVHPEDLERIRNEVEVAVRSATRFRHVNRIIRPDNGQIRWIETRAAVERDARGEPVHVTGVAIDVTERELALGAAREAEQALLRDNRLKDEFLAMLSHELRNPLAPIRYAAAVLDERANATVLRRAREVIQRQSAQLAELLDGLLDLSRISRNVIDLELRAVDLRTLIEQATDNAQPGAERRQQRLEHSVPTEAVWVMGDTTRLLQVIGNLIDNAIKYTGNSGFITVSLTAASGRAVIAVTDNGMGLSEDMLPRVFDVFSQAHRPLGIRKGGLGIGLTVVKRLVELHGGRVEATSGGLDEGSTFSVSLPLMAEPPAVPAAAIDLPVVPRHRPRILIVDDNPDITESLATLLRGEGLPTTVASDGQSALAGFDSAAPEVVLLDLGLPDIDGVDLVRQIRVRPGGGTVPIIAITGWGQDSVRERTLAAGVTLHLVKPVEPEALLRAIDEVTNRLNAGRTT